MPLTLLVDIEALAREVAVAVPELIPGSEAFGSRGLKPAAPEISYIVAGIVALMPPDQVAVMVVTAAALGEKNMAMRDAVLAEAYPPTCVQMFVPPESVIASVEVLFTPW